jgi:GeoRSP system radical SAM/SPASM protein
MKNDFLLKAPLIINWAVTNRCNFKCRHCYSRNDPSEELDKQHLFASIEKAVKAGVFSINFGGGEPLLRKDLLEIAQFAAEKGMKVSMNSNGYFVSSDMAMKLKNHGFSKIGISIDSHVPEVHDSFRGVEGAHQRAVEALSLLKQAGIETSLSSVICRINYKNLVELIEFARRHNVGHVNLHNFKCTGLGYTHKDELDLAPEEWRDFYLEAIQLKQQINDVHISLEDPIIASLGHKDGDSLVKGSVCGKLSLNIKSNGEITPCGFIPLVIGNIYHDDLAELWKTSPVLEMMRNKTPKGKCRKCDHYNDCLGGCTSRALALTGDINNPDPHCWHEPR